MDKWEIIYTDAASSQIEEAHRYIAQRNFAAADKVIDDILSRIHPLANFPLMGEVYEKAGEGRIRTIVSGNYRRFYAADEKNKRVEVLAVWHSSRQDPNSRSVFSYHKTQTPCPPLHALLIS